LPEEARVYVRWLAFGPEDDRYSIEIRGLGGAYFVWALEFDEVGMFVNLGAAEAYVISNWSDLLVPRSRRKYHRAFAVKSGTTSRRGKNRA
jgi:hypothetical protein